MRSRKKKHSYEIQNDYGFTNLDKIFWTEEEYTKKDLIDYYRKISRYILPYLKDRPLSLNRHPNGYKGKNFYQKDTGNLHLPPFVETKSIWSSTNKKNIKYLLCQNAESLLYIANLGSIEINAWNSRTEDMDKPDYMIIDLDPGKKDMKALAKVALEVHKVLDMACETNLVKTSGKRGLHILVPLGARNDYATIRQFAELLVRIVNKRLPDLTSLERMPKKRGGKIYLDYLQNSKGQTIAVPYSLRPYPHAPVSTPLRWDEVKPSLDPSKFNIKTIWKRLDKYGDLWKGKLNKGIDLKKSIKCLESHTGTIA